MTQRRPGKFEGCDEQDLGERLHELTMDGMQDEEIGSVDKIGWYGLFIAIDPSNGMANGGRGEPRHFIVSEDSQGFFDYTEFDSEHAARAQWAKIEAEYAFFDDGEEN